MRIGDIHLRNWEENVNGKGKKHYYCERDCENCPLSWDVTSYEGECEDYGCYFDRDSELSAPTIICLLPRWIKRLIKRIKRWEE